MGQRLSNLKSIKLMLRSPLNVVTLVFLVWFIAAFLLLPLYSILAGAFFPDGHFTFRVIKRIFSADKATQALINSLLLAVVLSVTVNLVGIFIVLVTRYFDIKGAKLLWVGYATSLIYGGIVFVSAYKAIYGSNGYITQILHGFFPGMDIYWFSGMLAVVVVMTFGTTGNHMLFLSVAMSKVDYQTIEAARMMGASSWTILRRVVLPTLKPMIFAITVLTFLGGLNAMMAPLILGGENFQTIAPTVLTFANNPGSRDLAAGLAIFLGVATLALVFVLNRYERKGTYFSVSKVPSVMKKQKIENPIANVVVHALAYLLFLIYVIPPILIVIFSFNSGPAIQTGSIGWDTFTLENYRTAFGNSGDLKPVVVSLVYSLLASVLVVAMILFTSRMVSKFRNVLTSALEYLLHIPWVLHSILMALGLVLTFSGAQPIVGGAVLTGTTLLLLIGYIVEKIPFTFRLLKASFANISGSLEEASSMLGASAFYTMRKVTLPIVLPTALAVSVLSFNSLLSEFDMSVFLAHPNLAPLGIVIKNATSTADTLKDSTALIFVYSVLLMIVSSLTIWAVYGEHRRLKSWRAKRKLAKSRH